MTKSSHLQASSATWWATALARLVHLRALPAGWDGYRGRPVEAATASLALEVLEAVCRATTPEPSLVPGSGGDLQIEWHTRFWDLEVELAAPRRVIAWRRNAATSIESEIAVDGAFTELRRWVGELEEPAFATRATTA